MTAGAIIPAAGRGQRLGASTPKALVSVGGRTLLEHSVRALREAGIAEVVVAAPPGLVDDVRRLLPGVAVVEGGDTRAQSVRAGLAALGPPVDVVLVHDAARALVPPDLVTRVLGALSAGAAAVIPVLPVADTVKRVDADGAVVGTVDRSSLWAVQTPQGFSREVLVRAHAGAAADATDDATLVERLGLPVQTVAGSAEAFKVTTPFDLIVAEALLARRAARV